MNKFSIIVPFYNTSDELIYNCEESLINQSYDNTEIIFVNDGSQRKYNFDSKVKVIDASHLGVSNARNVGIDNSTGDYILFVDSDDALTLNACREFNDFLMLNPKADIVFCRNFINSDGKISKNYFGYDDSFRVTNKQELLRSIFLKDTNYSSIDTPWSKIYSRQFINDNSIRFNIKLTNGEDGIFNYEAIFLARSLYYLNSTNYIYNVNSNSVCNTFYDDLDIKFSCRKCVIFNENNSVFENFYYLCNPKNWPSFAQPAEGQWIRN